MLGGSPPNVSPPMVNRNEQQALQLERDDHGHRNSHLSGTNAGTNQSRHRDVGAPELPVLNPPGMQPPNPKRKKPSNSTSQQFVPKQTLYILNPETPKFAVVIEEVHEPPYDPLVMLEKFRSSMKVLGAEIDKTGQYPEKIGSVKLFPLCSSLTPIANFNKSHGNRNVPVPKPAPQMVLNRRDTPLPPYMWHPAESIDPNEERPEELPGWKEYRLRYVRGTMLSDYLGQFSRWSEEGEKIYKDPTHVRRPYYGSDDNSMGQYSPWESSEEEQQQAEGPGDEEDGEQQSDESHNEQPAQNALNADDMQPADPPQNLPEQPVMNRVAEPQENLPGQEQLVPNGAPPQDRREQPPMDRPNLQLAPEPRLQQNALQPNQMGPNQQHGAQPQPNVVQIPQQNVLGAPLQISPGVPVPNPLGAPLRNPLGAPMPGPRPHPLGAPVPNPYGMAQQNPPGIRVLQGAPRQNVLGVPLPMPPRRMPYPAAPQQQYAGMQQQNVFGVPNPNPLGAPGAPPANPQALPMQRNPGMYQHQQNFVGVPNPNPLGPPYQDYPGAPAAIFPAPPVQQNQGIYQQNFLGAPNPNMLGGQQGYPPPNLHGMPYANPLGAPQPMNPGVPHGYAPNPNAHLVDHVVVQGNRPPRERPVVAFDYMVPHGMYPAPPARPPSSNEPDLLANNWRYAYCEKCRWGQLMVPLHVGTCPRCLNPKLMAHPKKGERFVQLTCCKQGNITNCLEDAKVVLCRKCNKHGRITEFHQSYNGIKIHMTEVVTPEQAKEIRDGTIASLNESQHQELALELAKWKDIAQQKRDETDQDFHKTHGWH